MAKTPIDGHYRLAVCLRSLAAVFGAYLLAYLVCLPLKAVTDGRPGSAQLASMVFFIVYCIAALRAFSPASTKRIWAELTALCAILSGIVWAQGGWA